MTPKQTQDIISVTFELVRLVLNGTITFAEIFAHKTCNSYQHISPRLFHLSKHAKKRRVRKKNAHRLMRMAREGG